MPSYQSLISELSYSPYHAGNRNRIDSALILLDSFNADPVQKKALIALLGSHFPNIVNKGNRTIILTKIGR